MFEQRLLWRKSMAGTPTGTILITGHSLGAAVGTLAMYMLCPGGDNGELN